MGDLMKLFKKLASLTIAIITTASLTVFASAAVPTYENARSIAEQYVRALQTNDSKAAYGALMHSNDYHRTLEQNEKNQISFDGVNMLVDAISITNYKILDVHVNGQQAIVTVNVTIDGKNETELLYLNKIGDSFKVDKLHSNSSRASTPSASASAHTTDPSHPQTRGSVSYNFECEPGDTSSLDGIKTARVSKGKYFRITGDQYYAGSGESKDPLVIIYEIYQNRWSGRDDLRFTLTMTGEGELDYSTSQVSFKAPETGDHYISVTNDSPYRAAYGSGTLAQSRT